MNKLSYIKTFSKIRFNPTDPEIEDIKIEDIAHALSFMCRANGHFSQFFSVAQHSLNCAYEAAARGLSKKIQLACLIHDASEAYLSDITRPVKINLPEYRRFEDKLQNMIYDKFLNESLTDNDINEIKKIDNTMLYYEFLELMDEKIFDTEPELKSSPLMKHSDFTEIEIRFLTEFNRLTTGVVNRYFPDKPFISVGIDGCIGKWAAVAITNNKFEVCLCKNILEICEKFSMAQSIIIDMPIGLAENSDDIRPDSILRKNLKGKASSVFNTPCRQAVHAPNYTDAIAENKKALNCSISPLSNSIIPKIREIDIFLQGNEAFKNRLVESHPEYCFALLNGGNPILSNKTTYEGKKARLELLSKYYADSFWVLEEFRKSAPALSNKTDDIIDALSMAVIGALGLRYGFKTLPQNPQKDSVGLYMQILGANIPDEVK